MSPDGQLRDNLARIRERIADACARRGRDPGDVRLVAVTKYVPIEVVRAALAAGVTDLGENQVQQLAARAALLGPAAPGWDPALPHSSQAIGLCHTSLSGVPGLLSPAGSPVDTGSRAEKQRERQPACDRADPPAPRWHMLGHVQRNKVKVLLRYARIVHSLDSVRLADTLQRHAAEQNLAVDVLIEVNVAGEEQKTGLAAGDLEALVTHVAGCDRLRLRGLMTMAPYNLDAETARPHFVRLRGLLDGMVERRLVGGLCRHLSMGMSQDYAVAVEEGATLVRIGSALFGGLPAPDVGDG